MRYAGAKLIVTRKFFRHTSCPYINCIIIISLSASAIISMNVNGFFDFVVQDDTSVDYIKLYLCKAVATPTPTATATSSPTATPTATFTPSPSPTFTPTAMPTPTVTPTPPNPDVGDAADNTNNFGVGMTTYPSGIVANFPTTFRGPGGIPGMIHWNPIADSWLGLNVSGEFDADLSPDADPVTNIDPTSNSADRDSFDDGVRRGTLNLGNCITNTFQYDLRVVGARKLRYVNVWMDYNRDGDWNDTIRCRDASGRTRTFTEWVVRNRASNLAPRVAPYTFVTPAFWSVNPPTPTNPMWMRMTLAESQAVTLTAALADGRGPASGYHYGETEDYYLTRPIILAAEDQPVDVDWETVTDIDTQALLAEIEAFTDNHIDTEVDALPETPQEETFTDKRVYVPFAQK